MSHKTTRKAVLLLIILSFLSFCIHLKYKPPSVAEKSTILAKYRDIQKYLDLFKDVELSGIYTNEKSGYRIISSQQETPFLPECYLDFIHLADVQLCDERAILYSRFWSGIIDTMAGSPRNRSDQEKYDYAVFKSLLLGIDSYSMKTQEHRPGFLIHSGDSVHLSLMSELWEFLYIFDQTLVAIPWFNVIGNHDVTVLGITLSKNHVWLKNPTLAFLPISTNTEGRVCDPTNYINFHRAGGVVISGIPVLGPLKEGTDLDRFSPDTFDPNYTGFHGFDMGAGQDLKGYYSFDYRLHKSLESDSQLEKVRVIVLNTSEHASFNAKGGVSESQVRWIKDILEGLPDKHTRVMAFGHHPLIGGQDSMRTDQEHKDRLKTLQTLFKKHVDVYFCGHEHTQNYDNNHGFLQIAGPSLSSFPQSGHKVKIEYGKKSFFIEVVPFSHQEMQNESVLRQDLDRIAAIWEKDEEVIETLKFITSLWKEERYLKTKDINEIVSLWESDERIKKILDEVIKKYDKDTEIKRSLRKAVLLKHAYLGRIAAMEARKETVYSKLGTNYKFMLPMKKIKTSQESLPSIHHH